MMDENFGTSRASDPKLSPLDEQLLESGSFSGENSLGDISTKDFTDSDGTGISIWG
jgi:hypothetical protein